jgi:hypothetical protein
MDCRKELRRFFNENKKMPGVVSVFEDDGDEGTYLTMRANGCELVIGANASDFDGTVRIPETDPEEIANFNVWVEYRAVSRFLHNVLINLKVWYEAEMENAAHR